MRQSLDVSLGYIAQMPFNFSLLDVHMWYIYLLIGLYLYMPVFPPGWKSQPESTALVSCGLGRDAFCSLLQGICRALHLGACSWNEFYMLYMFAGFNGYLLLGHYLRHTEWSLAKHWDGESLCLS